MTKQTNSNLRVGMIFMAMIFFIFGFITNFNIALKDQVQATFDLSSAMAQLVNGVFFFSYFCFSLICGTIIKKIGYKNGIIAGLLLVSIGSYLFYPAVAVPSYALFLGAVFIMATGVVFLQTAANPYVVALGPHETASARLNLTQALNGVATTIAPFIVGSLVLTPAAISMGPKAVQTPFLVIGTIVALIAFAIVFIKLPKIKAEVVKVKKSIWKYPHVLLGSLAIFTYVGAEVGCAAQIVPYLKNTFTVGDAAKLAAMYWGGAMVGRFYGSILLSGIRNSKKYLFSAFVVVFAFVVGWLITGYDLSKGATFFGIAVLNFLAMQLGKGNASKALAVFGIIALTLVSISFAAEVSIGMWTLISIGFFNSIMFPNIFALAVKDLDSTEMPMASGLINTLIVGGAVIPVLMGVVTDAASVRAALLIPIFCYAYITFYALKGSKIR